MPTLIHRSHSPIRAAVSAVLPALFLLLSACFSGGEAEPVKPAAPTYLGQTDSIVLGMGCFWGAEKRMSALPGVVDVVNGYAGGAFPNPSYGDIHRAENQGTLRNHAEVVKVVFDPERTSAEHVLIGFWENHDPTQGDGQGNDLGSNYRSAVYYRDDAQKQAALRTRDHYQQALTAAGYGRITTEIAALDTFYPAEAYHQDYLVKHPYGYCGLGGTGVVYP